MSFSNTLSAASTLLESDNRDTSEPETRVETVVESSPTPDHDQDQDQDQKSKPSKPKTRAQRNKAMRVNEALTALKREKAIKRQLNQIDQLRSIQKEIKTAREQQQQKNLKRSLKNAHKEAYQTKRLSKHKFEPPMFPVQLTEDLADNLRTTKTDTNLLVDRFKRLQERNLIEVTGPSVQKRKYRLRTYERHSYKQFK